MPANLVLISFETETPWCVETIIKKIQNRLRPMSLFIFNFCNFIYFSFVCMNVSLAWMSVYHMCSMSVKAGRGSAILIFMKRQLARNPGFPGLDTK